MRVPKLGWVRFRCSRSPLGQIKHLTISREGDRWFVSLCCEREIDRQVVNSRPPIGIDRGVRASIATSDGASHRVPVLAPKQAERLRRLRRKAGRQETTGRSRPVAQRRRSRRHQRTYAQIVRLEARERRIRRDFLHKLSTHIAKSHGVVVIERLNVRGMTRSARGTRIRTGRNVRAKAALNRAILAQGWGELARQLGYKVDRAGGVLVEVPPHRTSQCCSRCGAVDALSRSGCTFLCTSCGHGEDADTNAAKNILAAGLAVTARGALQAQAGAVNREPLAGLGHVA